MRPKHILYLTHDGLTDPLGQSQILPYMSGLAKEGFLITAISCEKTKRLQSKRSTIKDICDKNDINWLPLRYYTFPPLVAPLLNLFQMRRQAEKVWRTQPYYLVHCRSYFTSLVGVYLKRKFKVKFLFDMRGFWADERRESNLWPARHFLYNRIYNFFKTKEKEFLVQADHIITLTHQAARVIEEWRVTHAPITIIPTCVDLDHFDPVKVENKKVEALRERLKIKQNEYVLLYLGSWGSWYLTAEMLRFFRLLKEKVPAVFLVLTPDTELVPNQPGVIAIEVNRQELPTYLKLANASVFFIQPTFSKKGSAATKMGELLAMNIPIITNTGWGDVDQIIPSTGSGQLAMNFSNDELKRIIDNLMAESIMTNLRQVAESYFDLNSGIKKYEKIYSSL